MFYNISVKDALKLAIGQKAILLDLRTEEEYRKGHLPTAILADESHLKEQLEWETRLMKILYCNFGNYSLQMARDLAEDGFEVYSIVGGYHAYEGYVETEKNKIWTMEWKSNLQLEKEVDFVVGEKQNNNAKYNKG